MKKIFLLSPTIQVQSKVSLKCHCQFLEAYKERVSQVSEELGDKNIWMFYEGSCEWGSGERERTWKGRKSETKTEDFSFKSRANVLEVCLPHFCSGKHQPNPSCQFAVSPRQALHQFNFSITFKTYTVAFSLLVIRRQNWAAAHERIKLVWADTVGEFYDLWTLLSCETFVG